MFYICSVSTTSVTRRQKSLLFVLRKTCKEEDSKMSTYNHLHKKFLWSRHKQFNNIQRTVSATLIAKNQVSFLNLFDLKSLVETLPLHF